MVSSIKSLSSKKSRARSSSGTRSLSRSRSPSSTRSVNRSRSLSRSRSSKSKSVKTDTFKELEKLNSNISQKKTSRPLWFRVFLILLSLVINISILYFVFTIEKPECADACKLDWRHTYVKVASILGLVNLIILLLFPQNKYVVYIIYPITSIIMLTEVFIFYSYILSISKNVNCTCANRDHPVLTSLLKYYSYYNLFVLFITCVFIILYVFMV